MKSAYEGYRTVEFCKGAYFAGANTGEGFVTSYNSIVSEEELHRVYIIKGGSGCGKSTLMRRLAKAAEGRGHSAEYYLCGSDSDSLDCVVMDGKIAVLDGTFPHTVDMKYPGAASEIVDLSAFWDDGALESKRNEITACAAKKSAAYASAYRYLAAAEKVESEVISVAERIYDIEKAKKYAQGFVHRFIGKKLGRHSAVSHRYSACITGKGLYRVEKEKRSNEMLFTVRDYMRCSPVLMQTLAHEFISAGCDLTLSHLPLSNHIAEIEIPSVGVRISAFADGAADGVINVARFVQKNTIAELKGELRLAVAVELSCIEAAVERLSEASEQHFALERTYTQSMDFDSLAAYTEALEADILRRLG